MNQIAVTNALAQQDPDGMGFRAHAWREGSEAMGAAKRGQTQSWVLTKPGYNVRRASTWVIEGKK